ncbi:EstA family serine hydrolase [Sorangium cellulosum]|uniref:EstA family serine hydrolase n=1 Tax=Sorangium cellulosum TaxID=56 RepID=A0A4P2QAS6_SORCE|nr:serine hydrolase domain-containing protein [Sorangium cellulosum]AUX26401.1 EstA family serine hydrolase [Sorangium cellulosum]
MNLVIHGSCDPAFAPVRAAFASNFERFPELGAAVSVAVRGRVVVDLWAGFRDAARTAPWGGDTIVNVFSATKGAVALCAHALAERGALDLDAPVAASWSEFGAADKGAIRVRQLLDHSAGLPAIRAELPPGALYDFGAVTSALAAEAPFWAPGARHGYHAVTFGFLVGEVIRRASGRRVGAFLREAIAGPLGLDVHVGVGAEHDGRIAEVPPTIAGPGGVGGAFGAALRDPMSLTSLAFTRPRELVTPGLVNTERCRRAEIPAVNGHANARALARLYGALANGGALAGPAGARVLSPEAVEAALAERSRGLDAVLLAESRFSLGFMLPSALRPFGRGARTFGHPGAGGALGFADPDAALGFGYTPNQTIASGEGGDPRWPALLDAVYACL